MVANRATEYWRKFHWQALSFLFGIAVLQQFPALLPVTMYLLILPVVALWIWQPQYSLICAFTLGLFWASLISQQRLSRFLPEELISEDVVVVGKIISLPEQYPRKMRFEFLIEQHIAPINSGQFKTPMKVRLSWYEISDALREDLQLGQRWQLKVRLKPPVGFMNPGGFDYEAWLFSQNIRATGYVRKFYKNQLLEAASPYSLSRLRAEMLTAITELSSGFKNQGVLLALAMGERSKISERHWNLLLDTGTSHLIAISGLHIGMVASVMYWLGMQIIWLLRFLRLPYPWAAQRHAAVLAWLAAFIYAWLAGFSLPTQRALLMLTVALVGIIAYRQLRPAYALLIAALLCLTLDPFAINQASFWLSFAAVAVLIYGFAGRSAKKGGKPALLITWGRMQWLLILGLSPITVYWFGGTALTAATANLFAIPLVGFIVVPLSLLALISSAVSLSAAKLLLAIANQAIECLWPVLDFFSHLPMARWEQVLPPTWTVILALIGVLLLIAPRGWPGRWLGLCWLCPMIFYQPVGLRVGELVLTALDVGQGTAIVVETAEHALLYDAGPKSSSRFDAGRMVVLPFLKSRNIQQLDMVIISHGDNDHIGGAASVLGEIPSTELITSVPNQLQAFAAGPCLADRQWQWDKVEFTLIHPQSASHWKDNDGSCVLQISTGTSRILLAGDIEKPAESALIKAGQLVSVDLLIAPHHGSRTSSTVRFLQQLKPKNVVFTAGLYNRYGFPKQDIVERYRQLDSAVWITGERGALSFRMDQNGLYLQDEHRKSAHRYWHHQANISQ